MNVEFAHYGFVGDEHSIDAPGLPRKYTAAVLHAYIMHKLS